MTFQKVRDAVSRFLLFLSKTDTHVLSFCTNETRMTQTSLGMLVFLTGVFAFYSSFYAVSSTFNSVATGLAVAIVWATVIMAFDREIVSITREDKKGLRLRVPIALIIAFVISLPLELKLMEGRIEAEIKQIVSARNQAGWDEIKSIDARVDEQRKAIRQQIALLDDQIKRVQESMTREERDRYGIGPRYKGLEAQRESLHAQREQAFKELGVIAVPPVEEQRKKAIRKSIDEEFGRSRDLLSRFEALGKIEAESRSALVLAWTLRFFFVLVEFFPIGIKYLLPYNEYQAYLNGRRAMNIQKTHCYTNWVMQEIEKDPVGSLSAAEYTDALEKAIEDPLHKTKPGAGGLTAPGGGTKTP